MDELKKSTVTKFNSVYIPSQDEFVYQSWLHGLYVFLFIVSIFGFFHMIIGF